MSVPLPSGYPTAWAMDAVLADGGTVHVRPIRPDDAAAHRAFFARQSPQSVYFRFFGPRSALTDSEVTRFTTVDYHDRMAFVVFLRDEMIGVGRYDRLEGGDAAEVAFAVADAQQGRGLATLLLEYLASYAAENGITRFAADTLIDNRRMLEVFQSAGFRRESRSIEYGVVHLAFDIEPTGDSLAASERRAWTAGVQSIARVLRPQSIAVIGAGRSPTGSGIRSFATSSTVASRVLCIRSIPTSDAARARVRPIGRSNRRSRRPRGARDPRRAVHRGSRRLRAQGGEGPRRDFVRIRGGRRRRRSFATRVAPSCSSWRHARRRTELFRCDQHRSRCVDERDVRVASADPAVVSRSLRSRAHSVSRSLNSRSPRGWGSRAS